MRPGISKLRSVTSGSAACRPAWRGVARALTLLVGVAALVAVVASPARGDPAPPPPPSPPRVIFYGDSMLHESRDRIQQLLDARFHGSWDVEINSFPGSSICAWFDRMRSEQAQIVVLVFSGVWIGSSCEDPLDSHRAYPQSYYSDLETAIRIWQAKGTKVVLVHWPEPCCRRGPPETIWDNYQTIAARVGVQTLDPAAAVLFDPFHDTWPAQMPCLSAREPGCDPQTGFVVVRDGLNSSPLGGGAHLCPVQNITTPCPVYSSGVERYAQAVTREVGDVMDATVPTRVAPRSWWR